jgi:hypothetical protein
MGRSVSVSEGRNFAHLGLLPFPLPGRTYPPLEVHGPPIYIYKLELTVSLLLQYCARIARLTRITFSRKYHCGSSESHDSREKVKMLYYIFASRQTSISEVRSNVVYNFLFCLSWSVLHVPFCLYQFTCPVLYVSPVIAVLVVLSWKSCFGIPFLTNLLLQSCPA